MNSFWKTIAVCSVAFLALRAPLAAAVPTLLDEALKKERAEQGRWAFTETVEVRDKKDRVKETSVTRFDPSKPYAEQYSLLSDNGKAPSSKQLKECRERGEKEAAARDKALAESAETDDGLLPAEFGSDKGVIDLNQAYVVEENDRIATYKIPVRAVGKTKVPFDQIDIRISVDKAKRAMARLSMGLATPFRIKLVAKIRAVEIAVDYSDVAADFAPAMTKAEVHTDVSFFMVRSIDRVQIVRSDFKRVKPYDERFSVKSGPLKTLGF
jgi:hypothetical protein